MPRCDLSRFSPTKPPIFGPIPLTTEDENESSIKPELLETNPPAMEPLVILTFPLELLFRISPEFDAENPPAPPCDFISDSEYEFLINPRLRSEERRVGNEY